MASKILTDFDSSSEPSSLLAMLSERVKERLNDRTVNIWYQFIVYLLNKTCKHKSYQFQWFCKMFDIIKHFTKWVNVTTCIIF